MVVRVGVGLGVGWLVRVGLGWGLGWWEWVRVGIEGRRQEEQ